MISLDMRTVIFSFVLINIISTLTIFFLWKRYKGRYDGLGYLVYAFLFQLIAYILIVLRNSIPVLISIDLANSLSIIGIFIGYLGMQKYTNRRISPVPNYILLLVLAFVHAWFSYLRPDPTARYLIISSAYLIFFAQCAWLMLFGVPRSNAVLTRYTGIIFVAFGILAMVKIVDFLINGNKPVDYFKSGTLEAVVMIVYQMLTILLTLSFTTMLNNHLFRDIRTEEEKFVTLQDQVRHERNLLRTLIDHLPDPVSVKDQEGRYILNNHAHLQVIGAESQDEAIGRTTFDFFPEEDAVVYDKEDKNVLSTGRMILEKIEYAKHTETGFPYWHLTSRIPIRDDKGKPCQVLTISHDITERKRSEDALRESDEFNRSLLKTIPFGMDVVDETGTVLFIGENFRKMFGKDGEGKKCWELYRDDNTQCPGCPLMNGIPNGETHILEAHGLLGGKVYDIIHTGMMFHGKKAMLEIFHNITERKKTEGELIRSKEKAEESDKLKTAFLHNISHEIRTPMNAIVGFANLLREPELTSEERDSYTEIISRSSHHLLSIVNDVIEISNVEAGRLKLSISEVDLGSLLNDLLRQFHPKAAESGIQLCLETPDRQTGLINTDDTKLIQILSNLLSNSFKFTTRGKIVFGYTVKMPYLEFFVSDTGIGIEADQQSMIFERFYQADSTITRSHEGTGIGLSISKAYVELLGGKIWLHSATGKGSVFYFTIPYIKNNQT